MVKFYSQGCPQCKGLQRQLDANNIEYTIYDSMDDVKMLIDKGFRSLPMLELEDGRFLTFKEAIAWIKEKN